MKSPIMPMRSADRDMGFWFKRDGRGLKCYPLQPRLSRAVLRRLARKENFVQGHGRAANRWADAISELALEQVEDVDDIKFRVAVDVALVGTPEWRGEKQVLEECHGVRDIGQPVVVRIRETHIQGRKLDGRDSPDDSPVEQELIVDLCSCNKCVLPTSLGRKVE